MGPKSKNPPYSPQKLHQALEEISHGTPVATVAKRYQITRTTLRNKSSGRSPSDSCGKRGYHSVLGREVENEIVKWILDEADRGFPVTMDGLLTTVQRINESCPVRGSYKVTIKPSKMWYYAFLRRHPEVRRKHAEYVNKARGSVSEENIRKWFADVIEHDVEILAHPERIWNMDESGFNLAPTGELVLAPARHHIYVESRHSDKENITTLFSVNANGNFSTPLTLYKYVRLPAAAALSAPTNWSLGKTESGWMTAASFFEYIANVFLPFLEEQQIQRPVIVFLDGHSSHLSLHLSKFCRENGIILVALYPNATHIIQPLDVAVFKPIKSRWQVLKRLWRMNNEGREMTKFDLPTVLNGIIHEERMASNIISGFRATGLFPFDENAVDYSKIIKRAPALEYQSIENVASADIPLQEMHPHENSNPEIFAIDFWENKINQIDPYLLRDFKETMNKGNPWCGDVSAAQLFYVWRDSVFQAYHPNLPPLFEVETPNTPDAPVEEAYKSDESIVAAQAPDTPIPETSDIKFPVLQNVVNWPESKRGGRRRNNDGAPYVLTSQKWVDLYQGKENEKLEKEQAKTERKKQREEKARAKLIQTKSKKTPKKLKKMAKKEEVV